MECTTENVFEIYFNNRFNVTSESVIVYGRYEFLKTRTLLAIPVVIIVSIAAVAGTVGNALTLVVVGSNMLGRNVTTTFIMNLAVSDLFVTLVVNPMSLVGKCPSSRFL